MNNIEKVEEKEDPAIRAWKNYSEWLDRLTCYQKDFREKMRITEKITCDFLTHMTTKQAEFNFENIFGDKIDYRINHDILSGAWVDKSFDGIMKFRPRNTKKFLVFDIGINKEVKINWKQKEPTGYHQEVSIEKRQLDDYMKKNIYILFIIRNSSDPNYYTKESRKKMFFDSNKNWISSDGFQYYLLKPKDFYKGRLKIETNKYGTTNITYYYKIKDGVLKNFGKEVFDNPNRPIEEIFNE